MEGFVRKRRGGQRSVALEKVTNSVCFRHPAKGPSGWPGLNPLDTDVIFWVLPSVILIRGSVGRAFTGSSSRCFTVLTDSLSRRAPGQVLLVSRLAVEGATTEAEQLSPVCTAGGRGAAVPTLAAGSGVLATNYQPPCFSRRPFRKGGDM